MALRMISLFDQIRKISQPCWKIRKNSSVEIFQSIRKKYYIEKAVQILNRFKINGAIRSIDSYNQLDAYNEMSACCSNLPSSKRKMIYINLKVSARKNKCYAEGAYEKFPLRRKIFSSAAGFRERKISIQQQLLMRLNRCRNSGTAAYENKLLF